MDDKLKFSLFVVHFLERYHETAGICGLTVDLTHADRSLINWITRDTIGSKTDTFRRREQKPVLVLQPDVALQAHMVVVNISID